MTFTQLRAYLTNFLQANASGAGAGIWTQTEMDQYLRDGELKMFLRVANKHENFFKTSTTLSEVANTSTINLPTNTYRLLKLERIVGFNASSVNPIAMNPIDRNVSSETVARSWDYLLVNGGQAQYPMNFQMHGQKQIELFPTPSTSATDSLKLTYVYRPASMSSGSDTPFQISAGAASAGTDNLEEFHDLIALYALEACLLKEEGYAQMDRITAKRREREAEMDAFLRQMQTQATRGPNITPDEWDW